MPSFESNSHEDAVGSVPRVVVEALIHRGELASFELKEVQTHGAVTAVLAVVAAGLLLLGGFVGTLTLAASVWQREDRVLILGLVSFVYLAGAVTLGLVAAHRLKTWQPFPETRRQFQEDCACVHEIVNSTSQ